MSKNLIIKKNKSLQLVTKLYERLNYSGLIHPGSIIDGALIEEIVGTKYEGSDDWRFIGPYIGLKTRLESEGYFLTQKDCNPPGFRILATREMPEHAMNKLHDNLNSNYNIACVMANHDISKLSENEQKKHKSVQSKATQAAMIQHKMIMDQNFF
jgi:hypothetical protein